jgi:TonB family protein
MPFLRVISVFLSLLLLSGQRPEQITVAHLESLSYPGPARVVSIQGSVEVDIKISAAGEVVAASAISGHPLLRRAAEQNARGWKFYSSSQIERQTRINYEFVLEKPRAYCPETSVVYDLPTRVRVVASLPLPQPDRSPK